ncbi:ScbR family autoregulator-binding transcription factor [Streptomyces indicus]|uniref:DNA-binding transcriptional regulator, AcrR family n=1 Tax=Streptomyces indicus TaxID=417292 RepID=A0A1G9J300_9ACTN|nr:ScbR family autoregulator-binding transcription factor [Streptomyces indicus]SDL31860.1 DNA-binding transcriptional regulator, AcrR family [Streptomyces indicus]
MVKQQRAVRTRRALIRAAAEAFTQDGFASASLAAISRRAGVSSGALHFHFESKSALAQAVEDEATDTFARITREVAPDGKNPLQGLVDATHVLMHHIAEDAVVRAGFALCRDATRENDAALRRAWERWVEDALGRAERAGQLAEGAAVTEAVTAIVAATVGFEVLGSAQERWLSREAVTRLWVLLVPRIARQHALDTISCGPSEPGSAPRLPAAPHQK